MSKQDAEKVKKHLENAKEAAKPLNDKTLIRKIEETQKHLEQKID